MTSTITRQLKHLPRSDSRRARFFKVLLNLREARELYSTHGWALICSFWLFILSYVFILFGVNIDRLHCMELLLAIRGAHSWWITCNRLHSILYFCWVLRSIIILTTWVEDTVISACVALKLLFFFEPLCLILSHFLKHFIFSIKYNRFNT